MSYPLKIRNNAESPNSVGQVRLETRQSAALCLFFFIPNAVLFKLSVDSCLLLVVLNLVAPDPSENASRHGCN